ncbi:MAG TPA: VWA domain-containing protein [Pyrinomonadaceae bacterium]|nr:VWA domain-containing protein [Pyrinomonadaceae bacterium]
MSLAVAHHLHTIVVPLHRLLPKITRTILALATLFFFYSPSVLAQDDDVVRVNTDLVVLNVTVTDASGQYVPGLRLADFKVFEDGKEVPAQLISSFNVHESPFASVVLLDTSTSMESRLSLARSAAIRFLDRLRPEDVAAVFNFDSKVQQVQEFSGGRDLAPMAYGLHTKGMTRLNDAVVDAVKALSEREELRKAIVILSDGMDTSSKATADKAVETALSIGATIYAVDMSATGNGKNDQRSAAVLKSFADKTGGRFIDTPGGPALRDAFANIADELSHQYTIAYRPLNRTRDGKWRKLEVKLSRPELSVRTRKAYRAPKG